MLFSLEVYLDEAVASPYRDQLLVGGEPISVRQISSHTLVFELAEPDAWGERLFNDLSILPAHRLRPAFVSGRLGETWGLETPPEQIAGLGPFRLGRYLPGERLDLERNPFYWKVDREGQRLPYVETLTFLFVADADAQALRFQTGETHLIDRLSADGFALLEREQHERSYRTRDLGPGLGYEFLFFNLNDLSGKGLGAITRKQRWFESRAFRRAVSSAIDRDGIVRLVYRGRASPIASHISPGNKLWFHPALRRPGDPWRPPASCCGQTASPGTVKAGCAIRTARRSNSRSLSAPRAAIGNAWRPSFNTTWMSSACAFTSCRSNFELWSTGC